MEYLFVRLMEWARDQGYRSFSLGVAPLSGFGEHRLAPRWHRLGRLIWAYGHSFYNFQGLRTFKDKFDPIWEPRYLAASGFFAPYFALLHITALTAGGLFRTVRRGAAPTERRRRHAKAVALCAATSIAILSFNSPLPSTAATSAMCMSSIRKERCEASSCCFRIGKDGRNQQTKLRRALLATARLWSASTSPPTSAGWTSTRARSVIQASVISNGRAGKSSAAIRRTTRQSSPALQEEGGLLAEALLAQARPATVKGAAIVDPTVSLHTDAPLCSNPPAKSSPEGGFSIRPVAITFGLSYCRTSRPPPEAAIAVMFEDLKVAGTPLEIDKGVGEADLPEAMATLLNPRLDALLGKAKGGIVSLPLVELPATRADVCWRSSSRAMAVGAISTK